MLAKPSLSGLELAALGYYCVVFVWLASPIAVRVARGGKARINTSAFTNWRF